MPGLEVPVIVPNVEGMRGEAATVVRWLKKEGEEVRAGEPLVLLEFPKVELEVPAPASGRLSRIITGEGHMVRIHDTVGSVQT